MQIINALEIEKFGVREIEIGDIVTCLENQQFPKLSFNPSVSISYGGDDINKFVFTTPEKPLTTGNVFGVGDYVGINDEYYKDNKDLLDEVIEKAIMTANISYLSLDRVFVTKRNLQAISKNPNIKRIRLGSSSEPYKLTKEEYELFSKTQIEEIDTEEIDEELSMIFNGIIGYNNRRRLLQGHTAKSLGELKTLTVDEPIKEEELQYAHLLKDDCKIVFIKYADFADIFKTINYLNSLNKNFTYKIRTQDLSDFNSLNGYNHKNELNQYILSHPEVLDLNVEILTGTLESNTIKDYIQYEQRLIKMIQPALNLSPLEKYLFAYNVVKKYKEYKENEDNKSEARDLYSILDGEYMVCVGYSKMLCDLLSKLGIPAREISVGVDVGFDKVDPNEMAVPDEIESEVGGHARIQYHLVDPKYGVDGIFLADPTWDNNMDSDTYNYATMTHDEYNGIHRYNSLSFYNVDELFFVHSLEEFYVKANIWLDKNKNKELRGNDYTIKKIEEFKVTFKKFMSRLKEVDPKNYEYYNQVYRNLYNMHTLASNTKRFMTRIKNVVEQNKDQNLEDLFGLLKRNYDSIVYSLNDRKKVENKQRKDLMENLLGTIKLLDPVKFQELLPKYQGVTDYNYVVTEEILQKFLLEVGEYIVNKVNNTIPTSAIIDAIREIYTTAYHTAPEELESKIQEIIEINKTRQVKCFPPRYKVYEDGTKIPLFNEHNKWDIESQEHTL